jgi:hypothetical protein
MGNPLRDQELFEKIRALPEDSVAAVEDFVDSTGIGKTTVTSLRPPPTGRSRRSR